MSELFRNFEVHRDVRWQVILKLIGGSFVAHLLAIACVAYIPGLRDALNIAVLLGDATFVDKAYERTVIGDDVQMVELSQLPKFRYPDGYWAAEGQMPLEAAPLLSANQIIAQTNPGYTPPPVKVAPTPDLGVAATPSPEATPLATPVAVAKASPSPAVAAGQRQSDSHRGGQKVDT